MALHSKFETSAATHPERIAVRETTGAAISYHELDVLSAMLRDRLGAMGVGPGDLVGIYLPKSIDSLASILGILRAGAAYVPLDPTAPAARNAYIVADCRVKALILDRGFVDALQGEMAETAERPDLFVLDGGPGGTGLRAWLENTQKSARAPETASIRSANNDLAYILYTSGSTGKPKGVMITHENATSFVDWCHETFQPTLGDVFSSHAPFHFDLSILDIYTSLGAGATLVLISEEAGKAPAKLAQLIDDEGITIWYSAPSILTLLTQFGDLAERDYQSLRLILFAGEVFPIVHLRRLSDLVPHPVYWNLYGPTETNVCAAFQLPEKLPEKRKDPFPIGEVCSHLDGLVVDPDGLEVAPGQEGELCIHGPSVTQGYWNSPERSDQAFLPATQHGQGWYRTGDIVTAEANTLIFLGRRDRMVKKRGYRVELGEIETCLYRSENILEVAVIALTDEDGAVTIRAHLATKDGERLSLIKLKQFCGTHLPIYMIPDTFMFHDSLPKTSTDKIDYQSLKAL